jgi:hypothetical protein
MSNIPFPDNNNNNIGECPSPVGLIKAWSEGYHEHKQRSGRSVFFSF